MNLLLAFAPFIVFVVAERLFSIPAGLGAGAATAAVLLVRDLLARDRSPKLLEIGTFLLFGGLALYAIGTNVTWSIAAVRLRVDAGLVVIVLASMALRQPFSLQYARERVDRSHWDDPEFLHVNYVISAAWGVAFAVLVVADLVMGTMPGLPHAGAIGATVLALYGAGWFTDWYPQRQRLAKRT
jgi:hypothetical protein